MRKSIALIAAIALLFAGAACADGKHLAPRAAPPAGTHATAKGGAPDASLVGGAFRLDPLLPGGGAASASAQLLLFGSLGQPSVTPSYGAQFIVRPGFWTPVDAIAADRLFADGFESE